MHRAFFIDELLRQIFSYLDADVDHATRKITFFRLARVCKAWRDPAIDYLWSSIHSRDSEALLRLIPGIRCLNGIYVGTISFLSNMHRLRVFNVDCRRVGGSFTRFAGPVQCLRYSHQERLPVFPQPLQSFSVPYFPYSIMFNSFLCRLPFPHLRAPHPALCTVFSKLLLRFTHLSPSPDLLSLTIPSHTLLGTSPDFSQTLRALPPL